MALPAALCRIAACASAAGGRQERELPFALAERGMVVGGHRGMGMNAVGASPGARVRAVRERENTALLRPPSPSYWCWFMLGLELTPQHCDARFGRLQKDGCPIIFHDDFILTEETEAVHERRVTDLLLEELLSYGPQKESRKISKPLDGQMMVLRNRRWRV